ncbi:MAG: tRNA dihydrouridine synthase [Promethearchaeota archaeon]
MKLGTLELENRYILAPMQNVTTAPYRRFIRKFYNVGLVSVPMLYVKRIIKNPKSIEQELYKIKEEKHVSIQLIGNDFKSLKRAINLLESYGYDVLDINAGCPSKRAINAKEGGYLMKDLETLEKLVNEAIKYSSKPVSLKIRTGFERPMNTVKMAKLVNDSGIDFLIIHARPVKSYFYDETLDLNTVKQLKENLTVPLIGNGNIRDPIIAKHFLDYTNVDALMIGRESMGNPEIFSQMHEYFTKGKYSPIINNLERIKNHFLIYEEIIDEYLSGISYSYGNELFKFRELKRNIIWLFKNINNSTKIRTQLSEIKNLKQLRLMLEEIFSN